MRKHLIALLLSATLLASCGGSKKGAVADNRYRRAPILEVTAEELSNDSALIDATAQMLVGKQEEAAEGYRALLKRSPGYAPAHYGLGRLYLASGWMDSALYHTRMACRQDGIRWGCRASIGKALTATTMHSGWLTIPSTTMRCSTHRRQQAAIPSPLSRPALPPYPSVWEEIQPGSATGSTSQTTWWLPVHGSKRVTIITIWTLKWAMTAS